MSSLEGLRSWSPSLCESLSFCVLKKGKLEPGTCNNGQMEKPTKLNDAEKKYKGQYHDFRDLLPDF